MTLRADVADYFRTYDRESFEVIASGHDAPTEADVEAFEQRIGFRLPDEFRAFTMSPLGGLYLAVREKLWPRPQLFEVGPAWSFGYAVKVFGLSSQTPAWLDLRMQYEEFLGRTQTRGLVPVLQVESNADRYCYTPHGELVLWDHETDETTPVDGTFSDLLMRELAALQQRLQWKRGVGTP